MILRKSFYIRWSAGRSPRVHEVNPGRDTSLADVILGIKIKRALEGLILSQSHYVNNILGKFDKDNSGIAKTPVDVTLHLFKNKGESVSQVEYSRVIGSLMFLMSCIRLDIAYAVNKLSRYTSNPGVMHWQGIMRILKYLRFTRDYGLHYTRYPAVLEGYSDANWISNVKDSKSFSGCLYIGRCNSIMKNPQNKRLFPDP